MARPHTRAMSTACSENRLSIGGRNAPRKRAEEPGDRNKPSPGTPALASVACDGSATSVCSPVSAGAPPGGAERRAAGLRPRNLIWLVPAEGAPVSPEDRTVHARAGASVHVVVNGAPLRLPAGADGGRRRPGLRRGLGRARRGRGPRPRVVPRTAWPAHAAGRRRLRRGPARDGGWLRWSATTPPDRRRAPGSRLLLGSGGFERPARFEAVLAAGRGDRDRRAAARRPAPPACSRRSARPAPACCRTPRAASPPGRGPHRAARARGVRDGLGEAGGDRRPADPPAGRRRAAPRRGDPGRPTASSSSPTPRTTPSWGGAWRTWAARR